jgi:3-oxo-5-alpha-steroid 4-dehydrogenase 1
MIDRTVYDFLALAMIVMAVLTFVLLKLVVAPYGRHTRSGWGPTVRDRVGWIIMESPSLVLFAILYLRGPHRAEVVPLLLFCAWVVHYANRVIVYPLRLKTPGKQMPVAVVAMAFVFNVQNATMNASWIGTLGRYPTGWIVDPRFIVGMALFAAGMAINLDADRRLLALRAPGETGYRVPRGGLYELVSSPNYFGEIVEWSGWALASYSLGGLAFALFTVANLAPRAVSNHAWYKERFPDYPQRRRALIPGVW